ncbi:MAG: hypothetical protein U9O06_12245 [Euryarchaeota archaeon]|nr:hypothetical protein [Euryarchaeota archaeon]
MVRTLLVGLGIVMTLFPDRVTDWYQRIAFENPEAAVGNSWLGSAVRVEGLLIALCSLTGGRGYAWLLNLMGLAGGVAVLFPRQYLDWGARVAYQNPEEIEWTGWFPTVARGLGVCYVVGSLRDYRRRHSAD